MTRLAGKTALITGAARGIGLAFARAYVREGARVALGDIDIERARAAAAKIGEAAIAVEMDVTDQASIDAAVAATVDAFGQIDILINNAALFTAAPIAEITREDYARVFDINVSGTLFTLQAVARHMIDRGIKGTISNMASQAGRRGEPLVAVYCATKAAVISLTQSAGLNLIDHGIRVNAIALGSVMSTSLRSALKDSNDLKSGLTAATPLGRIGEADEAAEVAVFLASDAASFVTGQIVAVDGGRTMLDPMDQPAH